jgi:hypothetical protein
MADNYWNLPIGLKRSNKGEGGTCRARCELRRRRLGHGDPRSEDASTGRCLCDTLGGYFGADVRSVGVDPDVGTRKDEPARFTASGRRGEGRIWLETLAYAWSAWDGWDRCTAGATGACSTTTRIVRSGHAW